MIKSLTLRFGKAPALPAETFDCTPITVFVGPNNSGKSKVLQELHRFCTTGQVNLTDVILNRLEFEALPQNEAEDPIAAVTLRPRLTEALQPEHIFVGKRNLRYQVNRQALLSALMIPGSNAPALCAWYLGYNTLILDGKSRISLVQQQPAGDLHEPPSSSFQLLFRDDSQERSCDGSSTTRSAST
jgi:hypothetical protein